MEGTLESVDGENFEQTHLIQETSFGLAMV